MVSIVNGKENRDTTKLNVAYKCTLSLYVFPQKTVKSSAVDRLTDTSKYTGTHKERFDDTGKGKGIAGRKDVVDTSGYVTGFKGSNGSEAAAAGGSGGSQE